MTTMSPAELLKFNPWWEDPEAIHKLDRISFWKNSPVKWQSRLMYTLDLSKDIVYTIRGPRQIGKTTQIQLLIERLMESGVPPRNIFYWSCDIIDNKKDLSELILSYIKNVPKTEEIRRFIFLDEVTSVRDWQEGIKHLADGGLFKKTTVIATGSSSMDIRRGAERLPGRKGHVKEEIPDRIFLSMKFSEYAETLDPKIKRKIRKLLISSRRRRKILLTLFEGKIPDEIKELALNSNELSNLFEMYLLTGGIPKAVHYLKEENSIPTSLYNDQINAIVGGICKGNLNESYLRQVLRRVIKTNTTPVSWRDLVKDTDISHHTTGQNYVTALKDVFVLSYCYRLNLSSGFAKFSGDKKLFFCDPFFFHSLNYLINAGDPFKNSEDIVTNPVEVSKVVENVIYNHLVRMAFCFFHTIQFFEPENFLFFWKDKKNREIDFIVKTEKGFLPFEVKYRNEIKKSDLYGLLSFLRIRKGKGVVISKNTLEERDSYVIIPAYLFLLLI